MTEERPHAPHDQSELWRRFHDDDTTSKHLLLLYTLVLGLRAQIIADLGLGQTTGALRAGAERTGGVVYSCDWDLPRFSEVLEEQTDQWRLFLEPSTTFIPQLPEPIDLVMHDGAHNYETVRADLAALLPKMRRYGIICVHDTQQPVLGSEVLGAIRDGCARYQVSITNLPYAAGLAIIRVEESAHPAVEPASGLLPDGMSDTQLIPFTTRWCAAEDRLTRRSAKTIFFATVMRAVNFLDRKGLRKRRLPPHD